MYLERGAAVIKLEQMSTISIAKVMILLYVSVIWALVVAIIVVAMSNASSLSLQSALGVACLEGLARTVATLFSLFLLFAYPQRVVRHALAYGRIGLPEQALIVWMIILLNATPAFSVYMPIFFWMQFSAVHSEIKQLSTDATNATDYRRVFTIFLPSDFGDVKSAMSVFTVLMLGFSLLYFGLLTHFFGTHETRQIDVSDIERQRKAKAEALKHTGAMAADPAFAVVTTPPFPGDPEDPSSPSREDHDDAKQHREQEQPQQEQGASNSLREAQYLPRIDESGGRSSRRALLQQGTPSPIVKKPHQRNALVRLCQVVPRSYFELLRKSDKALWLLIFVYMVTYVTLVCVYDFLPSQVPFMGMITVLRVCPYHVECSPSTTMACDSSSSGANETRILQCDPRVNNGVPFARALSVTAMFVMEVTIMGYLHYLTVWTRRSLRSVPYAKSRAKQLGFRFFVGSKRMVFLATTVTAIIVSAAPPALSLT